MQPTSRFELVIFDCDGVLVDSEPMVNRIYVDLLAEAGYVVDEAANHERFSGAAMATRLERYQAELGWVAPPDFQAIFMQRLRDTMSRELQPIAGVEAVLAGLQWPVCVASNGRPDEIAFRLRICGLDHYFGDALFSGTTVPRPKPWPDVYLAAASSFGVAPQRCAVVEDSLIGVNAAVSAGMQVFAYSPHGNATALREAGATTFDSMAALPALLGEEANPDF